MGDVRGVNDLFNLITPNDPFLTTCRPISTLVSFGNFGWCIKDTTESQEIIELTLSVTHSRAELTSPGLVMASMTCCLENENVTLGQEPKEEKEACDRVIVWERKAPGSNTELLFTNRNQYNTNEEFELIVGTVAPSSHPHTHTHTSTKHTRHQCSIYNIDGRKLTENAPLQLNQKQTKRWFCNWRSVWYSGRSYSS